MPTRIGSWLLALRGSQPSPRGRSKSLQMSVALLLLALGGYPLGTAHGQANDSSGPATLQPPGPQIYLPHVRQGNATVETANCPTTSVATYDAVPVIGPRLTRPATTNPDLNLAIRGYGSTVDTLALMDFSGPTDDQAPQLAALFTDRRAPVFTSAYRVYDWDWQCTADGCLGQPIPTPPVTLVALQSRPQEPIGIPWRGPQIYNGGYIALILYAETTRLTLTYTREDNPAIGYLAHLEDFCVDPNLLALYRQLDAQGRGRLPGLRPQDVMGQAAAIALKVAIRDTGSFMDPRSRKDWWVGY